MDTERPNRSAPPKFVVPLMAVLAVAPGILALAGWAFDIAALKSILPGWVSLKPNAALAIVLMGFALLSISLPPSNLSPRLSTLRCRLARLCGLLAGLAGLVTLWKFALSWNPGVDLWWFRETAGAAGTPHPDRMGPDTALCFVLLAVALEIARAARKTRTTLLAPAILGWLVGTIALVALVSTFTLAGGVFGWWGLTIMSVPAGVAFVLLGTGVILVAWRESASEPALPGNPAEESDSHTGFAFLAVFLLLAAALIATGAFYFRNYALQFRAQVEQQLSAITDLKVNGLVRWRKERLGDANTFYKNPAFSILVRRFFEKPQDPDARRLLLTWMTRVQDLDYERVILADPRGVICLSAPEVPPAAVPHLARDAAAGLGSGQIAFLDLHRDTPSGPIRMAVMVPIFDEPDGRRPLGLIVLQIDPARYLYPFIKRWPTPSPTAETLLVRREGNEVVFLNELRFQANAALVLRAPLDRVAQPAVQAVLGREGVFEGRDYRGVQVVAALRTIPDSPWALVSRIDAAEMRGPMRDRLWQTTVLLGALLLGAGACVGLVWRQQRVRFYREREAAANTIRESEELFRATFEQAAAGIAHEGLDGRWLRVNRRLCDIVGYSREELLQKTFLDITHPDDLESDLAMKHQVLAGDLQTYAREKRYIRKDCSVVPINLTVSLVRGTSGEPKFFISVVEDITGRKLAEEALRASEERLSFALQAIHTGAWELDLLDHTSHRTLTHDRVFGYETLLPRWTYEMFLDHVLPEDRPAVDRSFREATAAQRDWSFECRIRRTDGEVRWIWAVGAQERDSAGKATRMYGIVQDITERKRVEEALRESEERFRALVTASSDVVYRMNPDWSEMWHLRGRNFLADTDAPNRNWLQEYVHPDDQSRVMSVINEAARTRSMFELEHRVLRVDGSVGWTFSRAVPLQNANGKISEWFGAASDITERKRAEEALRTSEGRLRRAVLYAPFPLMVHAEDGEVLMISTAWTEISGYSHAEIPTVGDWTKRAYGTRQHAVREAVDRLYGLKEKVSEGEYEIRTKLGEQRTWDFISAPLGALPDGRRLVMSMAVDVTERKRHEEELKRRNDELTRFTYAVSHDLKSPLVTIRTFLGYLEVDARNQDGDRMATDLAYIRGAAEKMAQLLDELLDLSRVGRKMNPLVDAPLGSIVQEALDLVAGQIAGRSVTIRATAEPILLHGDRQRLVEVFQNLVDNAVKFMGDQPAPCLEIGVEQRHGEFVIFVRDNGIGIDPRHRHKLFGLFEKLDPHTEGNGIGLALVQRIVEAHGGKIWVESAGPGQGATFRFTLANTRRQSI